VKTLRYTLCDVFTERPLAGSPSCVFTDARGLDAATMQALARETNLSETVFVLPPTQGGQARLRIFTPSDELPFGAQPVLSAAYVLGGPLESVGLRLELPAGVVEVKLEREGARIAFGWVKLPPALPLGIENGGAILAALGLSPADTEPFAYQCGTEHVFIELRSEAAVSALSPDWAALARATRAHVFAFSFDGKRCRARGFAPGAEHGRPGAAGSAEDPATASALGPLCLHLQSRSRLSPTDILCVDQGMEVQRPSTLYARGLDAGLVEVGGSARVVARGQFVI